MELLEMKKRTISYIIKQKNLKEDDMLELITFVENASKEQIFHLLITGKMIKESDINDTILESNNNHKELVEQRLNEIVGAATLIAYLALIGAVAIISMATELFLVAVSKQYRTCLKYKEWSDEFDLCSSNVKLDAYEKKLKFLRDKISLCKKAKDPKQCDLKVKLEINKTEKKIEAAKNEVKKYEEKIRLAKKK